MEKPGYILLVDDSANDRELLRSALAEENLNQIEEARDGVEALDFLYCRGKFGARISGDPILILLDIKMPRVDGLEVLAKIRDDTRLQHIPVVMLSSSRQDSDLEECLRLQATAYVVKPVDSDQFADTVKTIGNFWAVLNELPSVPPSKSKHPNAFVS